MSSRSGNWMVAAGALSLFVGLCILAAGMGKNADPDQIIAGAGAFSVGALAAAAGIYLKARALQPGTGTGAPAKEPANASKRSRGGCELCATEAPVIQCKVHQLHLCGNCLAQHYDFRSCAYVPSTRAAGNKPGKGLAAKARA
ncbi:MAG TPA: hypothetical protein VH079_11760 [Terriglobales bacterium]|jgi:hypothetical protein|nr:hypothetical protein [Terriglobales bacterium]